MIFFVSFPLTHVIEVFLGVTAGVSVDTLLEPPAIVTSIGADAIPFAITRIKEGPSSASFAITKLKVEGVSGPIDVVLKSKLRP